MSDTKNTRAQGRTREAPEVVAVRPAPGERRTPLALVDVQIGPAVLTYGYALLRRNRCEVRPPVDADGNPAVRLSPALAAKVAQLVQEAAEASPMLKERPDGR
jgi:hypothetical protein